jgi:hypothetical protein
MKAIVACFNVLPQYTSEKIRKNTEQLRFLSLEVLKSYPGPPFLLRSVLKRQCPCGRD